MMSKIYRISILIIIMGIALSSCNKNNEHSVSYMITNSISGFDVNYRDADGVLITETIEAQSAQDRWNYNFSGEEGDIVFVSAKYTDINSAVLIQIKIDGKVYKEGSSTSDTTKYLTVSGTIPFD